MGELQDNVEEIQNNLAGDLLTENPAVGHSYIAPNRLRPDHYKGMSPAEQQAILMEQEAQRSQKQQHLAQQKAESDALDAHMEYMRKMACYTEAQVANARAEARQNVLMENQTLAKSQLSTKSYLDTHVYKN